MLKLRRLYSLKFSYRFLAIIFEVAIGLQAAHAAFALLTRPHYFDKRPAYQVFVLHVTGQEWLVGMFALVAFILAASGLLLSTSPRLATREFGFYARELACGMHFLLWTTLGLTFVAWDPTNITAENTLMAGVASLFLMVVGPVMSDDER